MFTSPRANASKTNLDQLGNQLLQALASASAAQLEGLQETRNTQVAMSALLQNEAQRLQKKYGADHVRVQQINTSLQRNVSTVKDLDVELEIVNIRQPDVDDQSALVQGRVIDERNRGIAGLVVFLGNEQGQPLRTLGTAETDLSGYYALPISAEVLAKLQETAPNGVILVIYTPQGKVAYRGKELLQLKNGDRLTVEVTLNREDLGSGDECVPPEPPADKDWVVRGQVVDARTGQAIAKVQVSAIDNNRRFDDKLGSAITDDKGAFRITYAFQSPGATAQQGPDLYVTVIDESGKQLYSSQQQLRRNAGRDEVFEIAIATTTPPPDNPDQPNVPLDGSVIWFETRSTKTRQDDRFNGDRLLKLALQRVQQFLRQNPNGQVSLRGYASTADGSREEALALSQKRAEVIQAQLVQANLPAGQLSVTGQGINTTYPDIMLNQRVEIVLTAGRSPIVTPVVTPVVNRSTANRSTVNRRDLKP